MLEFEEPIRTATSLPRNSPSQKVELSGTMSAPHGTRHFVNKSIPLQRTDSLATNRRRQSASARRQSIPILHSGALFRNGIMQIMSQTLDSVSEQGTYSNDLDMSKSLGAEERRKSTSSVKQMSTRNPAALPVSSLAVCICIDFV